LESLTFYPASIEREFATKSNGDLEGGSVGALLRSNRGFEKRSGGDWSSERETIAVVIPKALRDLVTRSTGKPQRAIPWPRARWRATFPETLLFQRLPTLLDRSTIRTLCLRADASIDAATDAFLAAMVWGYGEVGYGAWRVKQAFHDPDAGKKLHDVAAALNSDGPEAAYSLMGAGSRLHRIGPAFGSKFLFFADSGIHTRRALILDRLVAQWLRLNTDFRANPVPWAPDTYRAYLDQMHEWAAVLNVEPETLELAMFQEMAPTGSQWAEGQSQNGRRAKR
jgi:hypothetical protein